jgi:hypothetical protein
MRLFVLVILSLQNSMFTVLRRYSQGVLKEDYSKYELLLVGEVIKIIVSAYMIQQGMRMNATITADGSALEGQHVMIGSRQKVIERIQYVTWKSGKMVGLAFIYGAMNILSFVSLRNIGAGMFTIFAQCKIFTTALFSTLLLHRQYSWTKWRALIALMLGVLLFSEPIWGKSENLLSKNDNANVFLGTAAVLIEVTLSGFASIYFEKVIKTDPLQLNIWERNFQLALVRTNKCGHSYFLASQQQHFLIQLTSFRCLLHYYWLAGKFSSVYSLYCLGGGWDGGVVWRMVVFGRHRGIVGCGRGVVGGTLHQIRRRHSQNIGHHGRHHFIQRLGLVVSRWTAHAHHGHCRSASHHCHL